MAAAKLLFMLSLPEVYGGVAFSSRLQALAAGLGMDMSMAGYLTILPALAILASIWFLPRIVDRAMTVYYVIVAIIIAAATTLDAILYSYWGMKLDMTPFFYFSSSPSLALASSSPGEIAAGIGVWLVAAAVIALIFIGIIRLTPLSDGSRMRHRRRAAAILTILAALLFIPIRGGLTVSTTNLSGAYFSSDRRLNHAAVNPLFSLLYSASHSSGFAREMQLMDPAEAERIARPLMARQGLPSASDSLLRVDRPDIILIILESFSSSLMAEGLTPALDSIAAQGLLLTEAYASSFRTDRAIPAILSGLPAPPTEPVMKHTAIAEHLPALPRALRDAGYRTAYYYGGDINFTNQRAYLRSAGIDTIVSDVDFPLALRASKWGVADGPLFRRFIADEKRRRDDRPALAVIQTSSSHEPFDVGSFRRHADPAANAFAYADSCLGSLIDSLKTSPRWERTLLVITPDHYGCYPKGLDERARHHIPIIFAGGAMATAGVNATPASQTDLAATILAALGLDHSQFPFSRDIFAAEPPQLILFSEPDYAAAIAPDGSMTRIAIPAEPSADPAELPLRAYLQTLYSYLSSLSSSPSNHD